MLRDAIKESHAPYQVDWDKCNGCRICLMLGCPAISWNSMEGEADNTAKGKKRKGRAKIDPNLCPGCGLCYQICKIEAIKPTGVGVPIGFEVKEAK